MAADDAPSRHSTWVDHVPVLWVEPGPAPPRRRLALFLPHLSGTKEGTAELLDPGQPDAYARYFYDQLNPLTHLER